MDSETVSRSDEFGYIYRYDLVQSVADERGEIHDVRSILVIWTKDCETIRLVTYPAFQLPTTHLDK